MISELCWEARSLAGIEISLGERLRSICGRILSSSSVIGRASLNGQHFQQSSVIRLKFAGCGEVSYSQPFDYFFPPLSLPDFAGSSSETTGGKPFRRRHIS